ncbi:DUF2975 domain-containing protein [Paenibacillus septentrionalis]|uniref:DUF2975 domain-containing protein n=1 Tax=Paenibacillus septentrionalis TaxID=429342 RepID=A0ABW1V6L6_9BACL
MKRGSTLFLKTVVILMGIPVLALCVIWLPMITRGIVENYPKWEYVQYPVYVVMYASAVAFYIALYQTWRLLTYIDTNKAFSELSVKALKSIKQCALTISGLYVLNLPLLYILAEIDDAPGLILLGLIVIFASVVIAVFAAVLQRLLQEAIHIKSENDLTV